MKKFLAIGLIAFSLGGCAQLQNFVSAVQLGTATVANPVTKERLYQMENAVTLAFAGLEAWKKSCAQGLINSDCKNEIGKVQFYTRQIPPYLVQLRTFVKNNDQVNAITVFNSLTGLINTVKSQAAANNVNLGN